jgi:hypothetical protein
VLGLRGYLNRMDPRHSSYLTGGQPYRVNERLKQRIQTLPAIPAMVGGQTFGDNE